MTADEFKKEYAACRGKLINFLYKRRAGDYARDVAQTAVERAWKQVASGNFALPPDVKFGTWLCGIAKNVLREHNRKLDRELRGAAEVEEVADIEEVAEVEDVEDVEEDEDAVERVEAPESEPLDPAEVRIAAMLPQELFEVTLCLSEGLSEREIAQRLKLSHKAVRHRAKRAREWAAAMRAQNAVIFTMAPVWVLRTPSEVVVVEKEIEGARLEYAPTSQPWIFGPPGSPRCERAPDEEIELGLSVLYFSFRERGAPADLSALYMPGEIELEHLNQALKAARTWLAREAPELGPHAGAVAIHLDETGVWGVYRPPEGVRPVMTADMLRWHPLSGERYSFERAALSSPGGGGGGRRPPGAPKRCIVAPHNEIFVVEGVEGHTSSLTN